MFWILNKRRSVQYSPLEDREKLLEDSQTDTRKPKHSPSHLFLTLSHGTIFLLACITGICVAQYYYHLNLDTSCARHVSHYSPVIHDVDVRYDTIQFNGSFFHETAFRKSAGPEVDAAWESLGVNYRSIRVPAELAEKSGIARDQVKINRKYGGGFPANVEGLHQLHCLNLLRQALYWNYEYYHALGEGAFKNDDHILQVHITHCLDIVRQQLMCSLDTGVLGQIWLYPDSPQAFVDFNTRHHCKNFHTIRRWAEANQLPETPPEDFLEPPQSGDRIYPEIP